MGHQGKACDTAPVALGATIMATPAALAALPTGALATTPPPALVCSQPPPTPTPTKKTHMRACVHIHFPPCPWVPRHVDPAWLGKHKTCRTVLCLALYGPIYPQLLLHSSVSLCMHTVVSPFCLATMSVFAFRQLGRSLWLHCPCLQFCSQRLVVFPCLVSHALCVGGASAH